MVDPNVSTPGYTRMGVVSYLAKVSEDSGARPPLSGESDT